MPSESNNIPKEGLTDQQWRVRLRAFAEGTFKFARGQQPGKTSHWRAHVNKITLCPLHGKSTTTDPFGRRLKCECGWHLQSQHVSSACRTFNL